MRTSILIGVLSLAAGQAGADSFRVSQLNTNTQQFEFLGVIQGVPTELSASDYYDFTDANPDLPPGAPPLVSDRSHLWMLESEVDGVCLLFIHDLQGDGSGGHAETEWRVVGDPDMVGWLVQDGPPPYDDYDEQIGDATSIFKASHDWPGANSDGAVIGTLNGCWFIEGAFTNFAGAPGGEIQGLDEWVAYSGDNTQLPLVLEVDRPIRIQPIDDADCNQDGLLNILDFVCFQALFAAGDPDADCNDDGLFNILDFTCFQQAFAAGCP